MSFSRYDEHGARTSHHICIAAQELATLRITPRETTTSEKGQEGYIEVLFPCIRLEFCTKSKLETLSKDQAVIDKLRLKILEYL